MATHNKARQYSNMIALAKLELVDGQDAGPNATANAMMAREYDITPLAGEVRERATPRPWSGAHPSVQVNSHVTLNYTVDAAASGTQGVPPRYQHLLRMCGMAMIVDAGLQVEFVPVSEDHESVTQHYNADGNRHALLGSRGNWTYELKGNNWPELKFESVGKYVMPDYNVLDNIDWSDWPEPLPVSCSSTPMVELHGQNLVASSLTINYGNDVQFRNLMGNCDVAILDRKTTGQITFRAPRNDQWNFTEAARNGERGNFSHRHGTQAGERYRFFSDSVQITNPRYEEVDGELMVTLDLTFLPDAGDGSDITLRFD